MLVEQTIRELLARFGVTGVSTAALLVLVALALYAHKASKAGRLVVGVGSTVTHDTKVVALVLAALLLLGVVSADLQRTQNLFHVVGQQFQPEYWFSETGGWVREVLF